MNPASPILTRLGTAVGLLLAAGLGLAAPARADEIVFRDAESCEEKSVDAEEITSETWTEIKYRESARGAELSVPTALLVDIRREAGESAQVKDLLSAIAELQRGNVTEAARQFKVLSGGGYKQNLETRKRESVPFDANDPPGRRKRPEWASEYAHFFYAKALYLEGVEKDDPDLLNEAYLALVNQVVPGGDGKTKTGGFLDRFEGGNSRWYPEAMLLAAQALVGLKRYDDAAKAFKDLENQAIAVDIGPRWAYEAKLGPGMIAEARGKYLDAETAYKGAADFMRLLLRNEVRGCPRREIGRLFSRANMKAAGVMLEQAEKNNSPSEFRKLRDFIEQNQPDALEARFQALPEGQRIPLIEGARDPEAQAVMQNGMGLAFLQEAKFEDAVLRFRSVEVKYFQVPEEHARGLYYLAEAADKAATAATGEAKALFESYRDEARRRLKADYPNSRWAR